MSICDVKVFAKREDNDPAESQQKYCEDWRTQCNTLSNEDKDNCLARFGEKKTPNSCLNLRSVQIS